jgi:hypothetical protein
MAASSRIAGIEEQAREQARQALALFEQVTPDRAGATLDGGWTLAAALAHIAGGYSPGTLRTVLNRTREGKSVNAPDRIVHFFNWLGSLQMRRQPLEKSRAQIERDLDAALGLIADMTDADLDRTFKVSIIGETTMERYLRYTFVDHVQEHVEQIRRALGQAAS